MNELISNWTDTEKFVLALLGRADRTADLATCSQSAIDWEDLLRLANFHRVHSLLKVSLDEEPTHIPPHEISQKLHQRLLKNTKASMTRSADLAKLAEAFENFGKPFLLLKGEAVSARFYPDSHSRFSKDIDLLVAPNGILDICDILATLGYRQTRPDFKIEQSFVDAYLLFSKDLTFVNSVSGTMVELHWRLFENPELMRIDFSDELERSEQITIGGQRISVLNVSTQFVYMAAHGAYDGWRRLKWQVDISRMLDQMNLMELEAAFNLAEKQGLQRVVYSTINLNNVLFSQDTPLNAIGDRDRRTCQHQTEQYLNNIRRRKINVQATLTDFAAVARQYLRYNQLKNSVRYKLWEFVLAGTTARTVGVLKLPLKWFPLYLVFGPLHKIYLAAKRFLKL